MMNAPVAAPVVKQPTPEERVPSFNIQRIYLKGTSLEMPNAPEIFLGQSELNIDLSVTPKMALLAPNVHEVSLHSTLVAKDRSKGDKVVFLLEIDQAGIFELNNIPSEHLDGLLNVRCPAILHSYLRVQIADTLQRASLPAFVLPEFDYLAIAQQSKATAEQSRGLVH